MMSYFFVSASKTRLRVMRGGQAVVRAWKIPKPIALVDSREQMPLFLFENHPNWFCGEQLVALKAGDYSVEGMEDILALERKSMADAIGSTMAGRERFIRSCARLGKFRWKAILIEASYEDMKTPYHRFNDLQTEAHPNAHWTPLRLNLAFQFCILHEIVFLPQRRPPVGYRNILCIGGWNKTAMTVY
jgi:ERCC4-type nuclease